MFAYVVRFHQRFGNLISVLRDAYQAELCIRAQDSRIIPDRNGRRRSQGESREIPAIALKYNFQDIAPSPRTPLRKLIVLT